MSLTEKSAISHSIPDFDTLWYNAQVATMQPAADAPGAASYGLIANGAIAIQGERIVWLGNSSDAEPVALAKPHKAVDCGGKLVTPGLIDCHTHLVYAGDRAHEFELRLNGASYADIAANGGGIVSTVAATREADENDLFNLAKARLASFMAEGVTTVEIKSGYGLNLDTELKMLRVAQRIGRELPIDVTTTFLGAHTLAPEFQHNADAYIDHVCTHMIPAVAAQKLADSVDAFCENIAFTPAQVHRVFTTAQKHGLAIKLHAEQLSDQKGAIMAATLGAQSVDHIEYLSPQDVPVLAANNTVAVLLPGAFYFLRETQLPPITALREHNVPIALASDHNPGSSPVSSLLLMLNMACSLFRLTPVEALAGITCNAAKALGLDAQVGTVQVGKLANLVLWDAHDPASLSYRIGHNPCVRTLYRGQLRGAAQ